MINFIKVRYLTYFLSAAFVIFGVFNLATYGLNLSVDFSGGTRLSGITTSSVEELEEITKTDDVTFDIKKVGDNFTINFEGLLSDEASNSIQNNLSEQAANYSFESLEHIQPAVGDELMIKTGVAVLFSVVVIFVFIIYSFKDLWGAVSAIVAMLHDTFILIGLFSFFGKFFNAEVDLLLITAILTVLSFSLYDTIVIFDKIKELKSKSSSKPLGDVINSALQTTMVRSINNSLTSVLALFSLILFVSGSLFWFALALLTGVILGTYSSPFVAANVYYDLKMWRKRK